MEISSVSDFLEYYEKVRARTARVVERIPADRIEWTYREGRWTLGDLLRHLGALERYMWAENVQGRTLELFLAQYPGLHPLSPNSKANVSGGSP